MSTEAGLWALVALLTVLVVILLALLLRAHRSNESAAKSQPDGPSFRVTTAGATALGPEKVSTPPTVDADGLRRRNAGGGAEGLASVEKEVVPVVTSAAGPRSPSRLQPPRQEGPPQEADLADGTRYQASLERSGSTDAWGVAWNVAALAMKRLILAGVDPASPAGAWNSKRKEDGCQPMQRGDEVVAVNEVTSYSEMRKELALPALQVSLRLVVDAASAETSPNREALRRRKEAGCSKASSASGRSNESSPMHSTSPKSPAREDSKPRSPQIPLGHDHVKVKNTFIEFSDETPREEEPNPVRFTQSDPTPVLEAIRNTSTTCTLDSSQRLDPLESVEPAATPSSRSQEPQEPLEASQTSASPGRRKPTPLSDDSEVSEHPGALPSSSPTEQLDPTSWIPETPEAFGFGGHPLLLEELLPEEVPMEEPSRPVQPRMEMPIPMPSSPPLAFQVGPPHPVLTTAPAPVLQYAPPMGQRPTSAPQEASERLSPEIRPHPCWTSKTLPLPPGALPPGPVASPISEASPSDASAHHEVSPGDSEESETEVTSPESKRKPTRRGGRRARHRKLAALARQQAAEAAEVEMDLPHADPHASPEVARSTPSPSGGSVAIPAPSAVRISSEDGAQLIGRMVLIQGLVRSPEFNGQWGHVESYDPQMQRFMVSVVLPTQLPGETPLYAKLRRDNLIVPRPEMPLTGSCVPSAAREVREVHWPAGPAFLQENIVSPFPSMVPSGYDANGLGPPGPAADFEDSVGALMTPGCRIQPGASLEDSGSPPQRSSQDSYASKPSMSLGTSPDMLSPEVRQMWLNQGTAADFEDSVVGQLFDSPKAASRGGSSPSSKLKRFGGGFSYAEGTPADFEDSIGGTAGWPEVVRKEESSSTGPSWQPSLRPKGHDV